MNKFQVYLFRHFGNVSFITLLTVLKCHYYFKELAKNLIIQVILLNFKIWCTLLFMNVTVMPSSNGKLGNYLNKKISILVLQKKTSRFQPIYENYDLFLGLKNQTQVGFDFSLICLYLEIYKYIYQQSGDHSLCLWLFCLFWSQTTGFVICVYKMCKVMILKVTCDFFKRYLKKHAFIIG